MPRPQPGEYKEYMNNYIELLPEVDILPTMNQSMEELARELDSIPSALADHRYQDGKWSVKQLLQHVIDSERVFAYRALCFARGEQQPLPGFNENEYAAHAGVSGRGLKDLCEEMMAVRRSTVLLFTHLGEADLRREGTASDARVLVNSLGYVIVGHWRHHWNILKTRYGV